MFSIIFFINKTVSFMFYSVISVIIKFMDLLFLFVFKNKQKIIIELN